MRVSVFLAGLSIGLSLIVAIGAQNAFVLRQGLRGQHVFAVALVCALSDALLIVVGVSGFGAMRLSSSWLDPLMRYGGAAFLAGYAVKSLYSALRAKSALAPAGEAAPAGLAQAMLACLAFTWLNPHVYLDTIVLLGAVSTQFPGFATAFAAGAVSGSFLFFFSLAYGAAWLRPVFAKPATWRIFEAIIGIVMATMAVRLLASA